MCLENWLCPARGSCSQRGWHASSSPGEARRSSLLMVMYRMIRCIPERTELAWFPIHLMVVGTIWAIPRLVTETEELDHWGSMPQEMLLDTKGLWQEHLVIVVEVGWFHVYGYNVSLSYFQNLSLFTICISYHYNWCYLQEWRTGTHGYLARSTRAVANVTKSTRTLGIRVPSKLCRR